MKRGVLRVLRGGSFNFDSRDLRTSYRRRWVGPEYRYWIIGFRIVVVRRRKQ